jgi:hypothetical protein
MKSEKFATYEEYCRGRWRSTSPEAYWENMIKVKDLSKFFHDGLMNIAQNNDSVILEFDTYKRSSII